MDPVERIHKGVKAGLSHLSPGSSVLLAYSGGVDSTVLLSALVALGTRPLAALHVVHNLRPKAELEAERQKVIENCSRLSVRLIIATVAPGAIEALAAKKEIGIEAAAREIRYGILFRQARRLGFSTLCTAHNYDDQLETLLGRFLGSSSVEGLQGIRGQRQLDNGLNVCRPLLFAPRTLIEAYAGAEKLVVSQDSTNRSTKYQRNKIRLNLVPLLDRDFPGWRNGLIGTSKKLKDDAAVLEGLLDEARKNSDISFADGGVRFDLRQFLLLHSSLQIRFVAYCLRKLTERGRISYKAIAEACGSIRAGTSGVDLLEYRFEQKGTHLQIFPILDFRTKHGYFFRVEEAGKYCSGAFCVQCVWRDGKSGPNGYPIQETRAFASLVEGSFSFPLAVRSRKPGDTILCDGRHRRIDDLLSSWRIDEAHRDWIPLVEDREGIVAVLASCLGKEGYDHYKFRDYSGTREGRRFAICIKGAGF